MTLGVCSTPFFRNLSRFITTPSQMLSTLPLVKQRPSCKLSSVNDQPDKPSVISVIELNDWRAYSINDNYL